MDYKEFSHLLDGQWDVILKNYGIEIPKWQGKNTINHPCPLCGGDDRAHWRKTDGRLSLYCRHCCHGVMKNVENVIMEYHNLDFFTLVNELADFINHVPTEKIYQAKESIKSTPKRNMPVGHRQDHEKATELLDKCELQVSNKILLSASAQYPCDVRHINGYPVFDIVNESGGLVNLATLDSELNIRFCAGGVSYGAWHKIDACDVRNTGKFTYAVDIIEAIHHWYRTGNEVRCVFDIYNLIWMHNVGMIEPDANLVLSDKDRELLEE